MLQPQEPLPHDTTIGPAFYTPELVEYIIPATDSFSRVDVVNVNQTDLGCATYNHDLTSIQLQIRSFNDLRPTTEASLGAGCSIELSLNK